MQYPEQYRQGLQIRMADHLSSGLGTRPARDCEPVSKSMMSDVVTTYLYTSIAAWSTFSCTIDERMLVGTAETSSEQ